MRCRRGAGLVLDSKHMQVAQKNPASGPGTRLGSKLLETIGNTPLLRLERIAQPFAGVELLAKAEWFNPGGSVKDRAAASIVRTGRSSGQFKRGQRLLDSTSGNTGIAYAMIGAAEGFGVTLCVPRNASDERKRILKAYGVDIIYTDPGEGSDGALRKAHEIYAAEPEKFFYANQYANDANWRAHYRGTANEIWEQTGGLITHFVAMLGTSGTFIGTSRRLKELNPKIRCISLQPDSPFHGIEGAKHMATAIVPGIYDPKLADEDLGISTEDAHAMVRRLAHEEGLLVGISAGAAVVGGIRVAREAVAPGQSAVIVMVLPDGADKYLTEQFWDEDALQSGAGI